jgi:mono/diheme cytochrome c family protein
MQPGLVDSPWLAVGGTALAAFVLSGAFGGSGVDGPENVMPPFRHLDDTQLAAVLSYVRAEFGTAADPVTVGEGRAARAAAPDPE